MKRHTRSSAFGFSLVELMISITLGLVLLAGVAQVFVNSKQGYRVQESVGRLQENARFATDYLSRYIRLADLWGGAKATSVGVVGPTILPATQAGSNCKDAWIVDPTSGLVGYPGGNSYPGGGFPTGCLDSYIPNSDVLVVRFADPDTYLSTADLTNTSAHIANGSFYLRTAVGKRADLFDLSSDAGRVAATGDIDGAVDEGVVNYQFQTLVFYLQTKDFGQGPTPTLAMLHLQSDGLHSDPLVDGIEMMKFEYGVDTDGDLSIDSYLPATSVSSWPQVLSVRVSLIVRGDAIDSFTDTQSYRMTQGYSYDSSKYAPSTDPNSARYQRRLIVKEVQLRNRVRK